MASVSWRVATRVQLYLFMRAILAPLAWVSDGRVRKNMGNMLLSERAGDEAP